MESFSESNPVYERLPESLTSRELIDAVENYLKFEDLDYLIKQVEAEDDPMDLSDTLNIVYIALNKNNFNPDDVLTDIGIFEPQDWI